MKCSNVMTKNPAYCLPTDTIERAAEIMRTRDVGPVPVVEGAMSPRLVGILTDRDVAVNVVAQRRDPQTTHVEDVMTREPETSRPDEELDAALKRMAQHQVRRLPVVDEEGKLLGIISQADVARKLAEPKKTADLIRAISKP